MSSRVWARRNIPQKPQMQLHNHISLYFPIQKRWFAASLSDELRSTNPFLPLPPLDSPASPAPSGVSSTVVLRVPLRRRRARSTVIAAGMSSWKGQRCITRRKALGQLQPATALAASMVITSQFKDELEPKSMTSGQLIQDS